MSTRHLIARGIGFNPGSVKYIPGLGMAPDTANRANGALQAQDSSISGTARVRHFASGALQAQASEIDGFADILQQNIAIGILEAQASTILGSASVKHFASGALQAQDAGVSGRATAGDGWTPVDTGAKETWEPVE